MISRGQGLGAQKLQLSSWFSHSEDLLDTGQIASHLISSQPPQLPIPKFHRWGKMDMNIGSDIHASCLVPLWFISGAINHLYIEQLLTLPPHLKVISDPCGSQHKALLSPMGKSGVWSEVFLPTWCHLSQLCKCVIGFYLSLCTVHTSLLFPLHTVLASLCKFPSAHFHLQLANHCFCFQSQLGNFLDILPWFGVG